MDTNKDQQPRQGQAGSLPGSGRSDESVRNAEPRPSDRDRFDRDRRAQEDLILHDDDEAELELPR